MTGHLDGSVRWWAVREPAEPLSPERLPSCVSVVPTPPHTIPVWELAERRELRNHAGRCAITTLTVSSKADAEKLLWTGAMDGVVRSWKSSAVDSSVVHA